MGAKAASNAIDSKYFYLTQMLLAYYRAAKIRSSRRARMAVLLMAFGLLIFRIRFPASSIAGTSDIPTNAHAKINTIIIAAHKMKYARDAATAFSTPRAPRR
jgi:hypothetical protein